mgnify:CR=1 FL=1
MFENNIISLTLIVFTLGTVGTTILQVGFY